MEIQPVPITRLARNFVSACVNLAYPRRCLACGLDLPFDGRSSVCQPCRGQIHRLDPSDDSVPQGSMSFRVRSFAAYSGPVKEMIHHYKYGGRDALSDEFAEMLLSCWEENFEFRNADALVPVPSHPVRLRERGYDHIHLLAGALHRLLMERSASKMSDFHTALGSRTLVRARHSVTQTQLSREERRRNVADSFTLRPGAQVSGLKVALIDDVITTGATLEACARVLMRSGAREVVCLTIARD